MDLLTAGELPELMRKADARGSMKPVVQFVMDWNNAPDSRAAQISTAPREMPADTVTVAVVAAVVHSLAHRDGVPVPAWVHRHEAPGVSISGVDLATPYGSHLVDSTPLVARSHGVYFDRELLDRR